MESIKLPDGWGNDKLSEIIETTHRNNFYVFTKYPDIYRVLSEVFGIFEKLGEHLKNVQSVNDFPPGFFFTLAKSSYLGAVKLGLGGQTQEVYAILRQCLENSLCGYKCYKNPASFLTFLQRSKGEAEKKKTKNEFRPSGLVNLLKERQNEPALGNYAEKLYELTIEHGAHPNESVITSNLTIKKKEESKTLLFNLDFVTDIENNPLPLLHCLKFAAEIGIASLSIFEAIFKYKLKILCEDQKLEKIKQEFIIPFRSALGNNLNNR